MILTILISSLLEASMLSDNSSPCYPGCRTRGSSPCRWTRSISIPAINDRLFFVSLFLHLVFMSLFGLIVQTCYEIKIEFIISILNLIDKVYDSNYLASASFERLYTRAWPMTCASQMIITQFKTQLC